MSQFRYGVCNTTRHYQKIIKSFIFQGATTTSTSLLKNPVTFDSRYPKLQCCLMHVAHKNKFLCDVVVQKNCCQHRWSSSLFSNAAIEFERSLQKQSSKQNIVAFMVGVNNRHTTKFIFFAFLAKAQCILCMHLLINAFIRLILSTYMIFYINI